MRTRRREARDDSSETARRECHRTAASHEAASHESAHEASSYEAAVHESAHEAAWSHEAAVHGGTRREQDLSVVDALRM